MHETRMQIETGQKRDLVARKARDKGRPTGLATIPIARQEARQHNQRREDRHLNLADRATILFRRKRYEVDVVNVSPHGVMLDADLEARVGARIEIRFEDCNPTLSYVRWVKGRRIGLEFAAETVLIASAAVRELIISGRRAGEQPPKLEIKADRPHRHALMLRGTLHCGLGSLDVQLRNISANGAMVSCAEDVLVGSPLVLELAGGGAVAVEARVRWCRSGQIGLLFDRPFDMRMLAESPPASAIRHYVKPDYLTSEGSADSPWAARTVGLRPEDL